MYSHHYHPVRTDLHFTSTIMIRAPYIPTNPLDHVSVLQRLRDHKLYAKASKCEIAYKTIEFLGQRVTPGGLCPTDQKLEAVRNWKVPQNVKDVRSFLGFASYYRRYVHQLTKATHPLTELTKKGVEWQWGHYQR